MLVPGPVLGGEPHQQGHGDGGRAGAVRPVDEARVAEERFGRAPAEQAVHQPENPRDVGRPMDDPPRLRRHAGSQPGPVDPGHHDDDEHVRGHRAEPQVERLPFVKKRDDRVIRVRPARHYLQPDVNYQKRYCAKAHGPVNGLGRYPCARLHNDAVGSDQANSYLCGQRDQRQHSCVEEEEMVECGGDAVPDTGRRGGRGDDDDADDDGVEDPEPCVRPGPGHRVTAPATRTSSGTLTLRRHDSLPGGALRYLPFQLLNSE